MQPSFSMSWQGSSNKKDFLVEHINVDCVRKTNRGVIWITPTIAGWPLKMELGRGSAVSIVPLRIYKKNFSHLPLKYALTVDSSYTQGIKFRSWWNIRGHRWTTWTCMFWIQKIQHFSQRVALLYKIKLTRDTGYTVNTTKGDNPNQAKIPPHKV